MQLTLKSVRCDSFRTINDETLLVDDKITILVGANESGKTNLLEAIELLDSDKELVNSDTKINSVYSSQGNLPSIYYEFEVSDELCTKLRRYAKYFEKNKRVIMVREGNEENDTYLEAPNGQKFHYVDAYQNISDVEQKLQTKEGEFVTIAPNNWIAGPIVYKKNIKLFRDKKIQKLEKTKGDKLIYDRISELIFDELPKVFLWKYSDKHYIPKDVPINFYTTKDQFQSVINLFQLGDIKEDEIASHLTNRDSVYIHNFLETVSRKVTKVINNTWKQRKHFKLTMHYKESWIEILVEEKGYQIDPKKRSEGLQWYLSFLINFRSKLQTLKNNIILFDQPGDKLHPGGQKDLLERLEELAEYNQIVYSTHTPFMINKERPERVRLVRRPDDDTEVINELSSKEVFQDELLRNSLGFILSDVAPVADKNILVEGLLDKRVLLEFINKLKKFKFSINLSQSVFIPAHGASKILYYANLLTSNGLSVIALFDNDIAGKNAILANKKKKVLANKDVVSVSIKSGAETIEDLLPLKLVERSVNEVGKHYKSDFSKITGLKSPAMKQIISHFNTQGIEFTDDIKLDLSVKIIEEFEKLNIESSMLKGEMKGLYDVVKTIKKKIN
ncbi:MAG: AAA family ATPase [Candidatus Magasanikbacteria bacterium]